jgi:hypothetical protein
MRGGPSRRAAGPCDVQARQISVAMRPQGAARRCEKKRRGSENVQKPLP